MIEWIHPFKIISTTMRRGDDLKNGAMNYTHHTPQNRRGEKKNDDDDDNNDIVIPPFFFKLEFTFQSIWAYCTDEYGLFRRTGPATICTPILCVFILLLLFPSYTGETVDNNNNNEPSDVYRCNIIIYANSI